MKRKYPFGLHKKTGLAYGYKHPHRKFIYEVVQSPYDKELSPLDIILIDYVEGIGNKGDRMTLKHSLAYNKLLLPGLAVYASPENIAKYENFKTDDKVKFSSPFVERTMNILSTLVVLVNVNNETPWTLEKWHVRAALRQNGVQCTDDDFTMPEKTISGPNMDIDNKEFYITVTINNEEQVKVRCRIHHVHKTPLLSSPTDEHYFTYATEPIFPEDQTILDSMPIHKLKKKLLSPTEIN